VHAYFEILDDTLLGYRVPAWKKSAGRRMIETEKFYLFDVGVTNYLSRRRPAPGTPEFGLSFEQYILMELKTWQAYRNPELEIRHWRSASGLEVDFILGDMRLALEVKSSSRISYQHLKGLRIIRDECAVKKTVLVSTETLPRTVDGIEILPWRIFIDNLWAGAYEL